MKFSQKENVKILPNCHRELVMNTKCYAYNIGSNYTCVVTHSSHLQGVATDVDRKQKRGG